MSSACESTIIVFVVELKRGHHRDALLACQGVWRGIFDAGGGREAGVRRRERGKGNPRGEAELGPGQDGEALAFAEGGALPFDRTEARVGWGSPPAHSRRVARGRGGYEGWGRGEELKLIGLARSLLSTSGKKVEFAQLRGTVTRGIAEKLEEDGSLVVKVRGKRLRLRAEEVEWLREL